MLFDTHCHLNDEQFAEDLDSVLRAAEGAGVKRVVVPAYDHPSLERALRISERYPSCYAAVGYHPHDCQQVTEASYERLVQAVAHPRVVAIGEIGLDFYYEEYPRDVQEAVFRRQIRFAREVGLPIIVHDRDAHGRILDVLREERASEVGGIMHCFSGSSEMVKPFVDLNFYISLGGPVTFKNARKPQEVAAVVPDDRLLIETDAPWLAPHPNRGKRNEPAYVRLVAEKIAQIKGWSIERLAEQTSNNACRLFRLPRLPEVAP